MTSSPSSAPWGLWTAACPSPGLLGLPDSGAPVAAISAGQLRAGPVPTLPLGCVVWGLGTVLRLVCRCRSPLPSPLCSCRLQTLAWCLLAVPSALWSCQVVPVWFVQCLWWPWRRNEGQGRPHAVPRRGSSECVPPWSGPHMSRKSLVCGLSASLWEAVEVS